MSYSINQSADQTEDTNDESAPDQVIKAIDAINYSSQIHVSHHSILIEELPEVEEAIEAEIDQNVLVTSASKALKILFRRIISPNAP